MEAASQLVRSIGPARLAAMGAVAVMLVGFFAVLILRLSAPTMVPLYADLDLDDSSAIVGELESRNVPFELSRGGAVILVPQERVPRLRMDLAADGLPRGGSVGYEVFDRGDTLGATSFVQNINHLRALEGELSRTIRAIDRVGGARVHLVIPERQLFARERPEPSASIALNTRGALEPAQIRAIQHLVASAVQGLSPGRVSVVDETGRLLADGRGSDDPGSITMIDERRQAIERKLRDQVEDILASIVGRDRVRVQVATELDLNRITQTSDVFDPDGRVLRSTQTREETARSTEAGDDGVTVSNELPDAALAGAGPASEEDSSRLEETLNYEISRTTRTETTEPGGIRRVSVAVVVDGRYAQTDDGDVVYEPRSQEELDRIAALVRSAIGYDEGRGDSVEIANLRFAEAPQAASQPISEPFLPRLSRGDIVRLAEIAALAVLALLVLLFVARPLVQRVLSPEDAPSVPAEPAPARIEGPSEMPQLAPPMPRNEAIELAQVAGEVQASSVRRIGEMIHQNPNEAVTIIRNWIQEPAS